MSCPLLHTIWVAAIVVLPAIWLAAAEPEDQRLARTLLKALPETHKSHPGLIHVDEVEDLASGKQYRLCMVQGGPTYNQDGGLGLFTRSGALLSAQRIEGLDDAPPILSRLKTSSSLPHAIQCSAVTGTGTGSHSTDYIILAPVNGKLVQLFRCEANAHHWLPGGDGDRWEYHVVTLTFISRNADVPPDLLRMAYHEIDGHGTSQTTVFRYDQTGPAYKQVPSLKQTTK